MTTRGIRLRHLAFLGPHREPAIVKFGPGLNVIYGASDTGKSFVVEAIDFMLGGKPPLRDVPERVGYDQVFLGIETLDGTPYTVYRSVDGGRFRVFDGLHFTTPDGIEGSDLSELHSDRNVENLSSVLLEKTGLAGRRICRNKRGKTNSLSFRYLARLTIVTETEITDQKSPLSDGNPTADTANFATFKLLLTGVDDSALVEAELSAPEEQTREVQGELLDQLIGDYRERLKKLAKQPKELDDQLGRIEQSLDQQTDQLARSESDYRTASARRRELRERVEQGRDRREEIAGLLERFSLLGDHYQSDVGRLKGIEEAGTLFVTFGQARCPLCGADPEHRQREGDCGGNVDAVVAAARSEIAKIALLKRELDDTVSGLQKDAAAFDRSLPKLEEQLVEVSSQLDQHISPQLSRLRATYAQLANKRGEVREALGMYRTVEDLRLRREALSRDASGDSQNAGEALVADGDLPDSVAQKFADEVESLLRAWHFPEVGHVHFDPKARDVVIAGKARIARGKGLRSITHAAFTIGLLQYCRLQDTPHPGFVVLDLPLLAYRAPEGADDDLSGTDLDDQFYSYLARLPNDRQVIVIENTDPPAAIRDSSQATMFSKNPNVGRYGFFPMIDVASAGQDSTGT